MRPKGKMSPMFRRTTIRVVLSVGIACVLLGALIGSARAFSAAENQAVAGKIAPDVWAASSDGAETEFLVVLGEQGDVSAAHQIANRNARLQYVYDVLRGVAARSQAPLKAELDASGVDYRAFYVANVVWVRAERGVLASLARRAEVAKIVANPEIREMLPDRDSAQGVSVPAEVEWNVAQINADRVWALGYRGQSIVVAGQDTGYEWDHLALVRQYRGWNGTSASHDYNWHDAIHSGGGICGADSSVPCDDTGHGTHTMGTIVGDDGGVHQIGVAPGARWIGCRNMDRGVGTPATYIECFEFFLAPYPIGGNPLTDGEPGLAPHVINNSWSCPPSEGCSWETLQTVVENVRAAGIFVVVSAGNEGSSCSSVQDPPAIYDAAFSVGATNSSDDIASFSSRGPVTVDGSGRLKPDVAAPGVGIYSSVPGGGYAVRQGTSMAGPHVAGTVALLWSAEPALIGDIDATEWAITSTTVPLTSSQYCGNDGPGDVPNNVYGYGRVDALAALPDLLVSKLARFSGHLLPDALIYTLSTTNTGLANLAAVVLSDTIPAGVGFLGASGNYVRAGDNVTWALGGLNAGASASVNLTVSVEGLTPGMPIVNGSYGVSTTHMAEPVMGRSVTVTIPYRYLLVIVMRDA